MENEKFLPTGWHWKITPEQIEKIKANDRDTVNQVYFDNLDKFKAMAAKYCSRVRKWSYFDDCVQQVYVDLSSYDFTDSGRLFWSIRDSFRRAAATVLSHSLSLDRYVSDMHAGMLLCDTLPTYDMQSDNDRIEENAHVLAAITAQRQLSDKDRDILTAYAFGCHAYRGLYARACKECSV